ncbi:MAG: hypothetical protein AAF846_14230 [Chloroflexota bacterium]
MSYETDEHNTLPRKNVEWAEAIVKWTRYDYVAVYDYPTLKNSEQVMEIYIGDMVNISKRYRREDWCLVQVGHILGWVFLQDVRFMTQGMRAPRPKSRVPQPRIPTRLEPDANEVETMPMPQVVELSDIEDTRPAQAEAVIKPGTGELTETQASRDTKKRSAIQKLIGFFSRR